MNEAAILQELATEAKEIGRNIEYTKKHIKDPDLILTEDDIEALGESDKDLKEGRTKRL